MTVCVCFHGQLQTVTADLHACMHYSCGYVYVDMHGH